MFFVKRMFGSPFTEMTFWLRKMHVPKACGNVILFCVYDLENCNSAAHAVYLKKKTLLLDVSQDSMQMLGSEHSQTLFHWSVWCRSLIVSVADSSFFTLGASHLPLGTYRAHPVPVLTSTHPAKSAHLPSRGSGRVIHIPLTCTTREKDKKDVMLSLKAPLNYGDPIVIFFFRY